MGDVKTLDFVAFVSARYDVKREMYPGAANPIAIRGPHHIPTHNYDVPMTWSSPPRLAASPTTEKNFSPFQFRQYRILEFPRFCNFARVLCNDPLPLKASAS